MFVFKYLNGKLPYIFNNLFIKNSQIHQYATRARDEFYIPQYRTNYRKFSVRISAALYWNAKYKEMNQYKEQTDFKNKSVYTNLELFKKFSKHFIINQNVTTGIAGHR